MNAITATANTATTNVGTFATLVTQLGEVSVSELDALKKAQKGLTLDELASAASKDENKGSSLLGNYARIHFQIGQTLIHGNQTGLKGLAKASKKTSGAFRAMVSLGVCSESGDLKLSVDKGIENKKHADATWSELAVPFVAHLWANRESQRASESEARKASAEKKATEKPAAEKSDVTSDAESDSVAPVELSPGQMDNLAVIRIKDRIAHLSAENVEALRALLATLPEPEPEPEPVPVVPEPAPKPKKQAKKP
jgi:hypothetical protein